MQNPHRSPWMRLLLTGMIALFFGAGCASAQHHVAQGATPEAPPDEPEPLLYASLSPVLADYEGAALKVVAHLAEDNPSNLYYVGAIAFVLGALIVARSLSSNAGHGSPHAGTTPDRAALEIAVRILSSADPELTSAQRYATSEGDLTAAQVELVQTVRRLRGRRLSSR